MTRRALAFLLLFAFAPTASGDELTYEQAKQHLKPTPLPEFWIGDVAGLPARWEKLRAGTCEVIAASPGGRPLHLIVYGEPENVRHRANFNSAIGGQDPSAYLDKDARKKPVVFSVGPVHGHEVEAARDGSQRDLNSPVGVQLASHGDGRGAIRHIHLSTFGREQRRPVATSI